VTSAAAGSQAGAARTRGISLLCWRRAGKSEGKSRDYTSDSARRQAQRRCRCRLRLESYLNAGRTSEIEAFRCVAAAYTIVSRASRDEPVWTFSLPSSASRYKRLSRDVSSIYDRNTGRAAGDSPSGRDVGCFGPTRYQGVLRRPT